MVSTFEMEVGGRILTLETGRLAGLADGAVSVRYGDTMVLATACASKSLREGGDFLPLTVDVEEKKELAAAFFRADSDDGFRRRLLRQYQISYVFVGPRERQMGGFDASRSPYLALVHINPDVSLYQFRIQNE